MNKLTIESLLDLYDVVRDEAYQDRNINVVDYARVAGHGDYGIVREPCPVHLTKYDKPELWQQGIEWR